LNIKRHRFTISLNHWASVTRRLKVFTLKQIKKLKKTLNQLLKKILKSPADTVLIFEDEFSLSNTATVSYQSNKKGKQPLVSCTQRNKEKLTAMRSYNYATGQMTVTFHLKGNYQNFKKHLRKLLYT